MILKLLIQRFHYAFIVEWKSDIDTKDQRNILRMVEANSKYIVDKWFKQFGEITYYC